jgi:methanogenic corrinoid protein MtbC1
LLKAAVDAGDRIGEAARMDPAELKRRSALAKPRSAGRLDDLLTAIEQLDAAEVQRLLALQLSALGPAGFAGEVAVPLVGEIGERWAHGKIGIAAEHLAAGILRSMLGAALQPTATSLLGPRIVFATPTGERHELGLLMAALTALGAGANPLFLGAEVPVDDLLGAVKDTDSAALALGLVTIPAAEAAPAISALRAGLADEVRLWLGGAGARELELPGGVDRIDSLEDLEQRVALLGFEGPSALRIR